MATQAVARTMGRGLSRLESYVPSARAATAFGEPRRALDRPPTPPDAAPGPGFWDRNFGRSAHRPGQDARLAVGRLIWQLVNLAGVDDHGVVNDGNDALRWRVLDALDLKPEARRKLADSPVPPMHGGATVPPMAGDVRDAVCAYAFHARANAIGARSAAERIVPLFMRLGLSRAGADHFARAAEADYLAEREPLTFHYRTLRTVVTGIGRHLFLPLDVIAEAARQVTRYNPHEASRAGNADTVRATGGLDAAVSGAAAAPAMSIAASVARHLFAGRSTTAIDAAFTTLGLNARVPRATVDGWLAWNRD